MTLLLADARRAIAAAEAKAIEMKQPMGEKDAFHSPCALYRKEKRLL